MLTYIDLCINYCRLFYITIDYRISFQYCKTIFYLILKSLEFNYNAMILVGNFR